VNERLVRWCALATVLAAAFVVYGSLMPFHLEGPLSLDRAVTTLSHSLAGSFSRSDFAANILLFLPIGFFGAATLAGHRSSFARWLLSTILLLTFSLALSIAVELLQAFLPMRTSSLYDVMAEISGAVIGLAAWRVLCGEVARWTDRWSVGDRGGIARGALVLYTLARVGMILWPLDVTLDLGGLAHKFRSGGVVFNPLHSPAFTLDSLPSTLMSGLLAVPVGLWLAVAGLGGRGRRATSIGVSLAIAFFLAVEGAQLFILSCRADSAEFLVNAAGAAIGVVVAAVFVRPVSSAPARPASMSNAVPLVGLGAALAFYAIYNWSPFDFTFSGDLIRSRIGNLVGVPFYGYYINPEFKALDDALIKISIAIPIGVFVALWIGRGAQAYRRLAIGAALFLVATFLTIVEAGQVVLPSRYADDSDIILAFCGVVAGMWVTSALAFRRAQPLARHRRHSRRAGSPGSPTASRTS
jgi:VanZ family protein